MVEEEERKPREGGRGEGGREEDKTIIHSCAPVLFTT